MTAARGQRGAGTILVLGICLILATLAVGAAGLGRMVAVRAEAQDLADAAALGCARLIQRERDLEADCSPALDAIRASTDREVELECGPNQTDASWQVICDAQVAVPVPRFMALDGSRQVSARATAELPYMHVACAEPRVIEFYDEVNVDTIPLPVGDYFVPLGEVRGWPEKCLDDDGGWQMEFEVVDDDAVVTWRSDRKGTRDKIELRSCVLGFTGSKRYHGHRREEVPPDGGAQRVGTEPPPIERHPREGHPQFGIALVTGYWNGTDDDMSYATDLGSATESFVDVTWASGAGTDSSDALIVYCTRTPGSPLPTITCEPDAPGGLTVVAERDIDEGLLQIVAGDPDTRGVRILEGGEPIPLPGYVEEAFEQLQFQPADLPYIQDFFDGGEPEAQEFIDRMLDYAPNRYAVAELITLSLPDDYLVETSGLLSVPKDNSRSWDLNRLPGLDQHLAVAAISTYETSGNDRFQFYAACDEPAGICSVRAGAEPGGSETEIAGGAFVSGVFWHIQWSSQPKLVGPE